MRHSKCLWTAVISAVTVAASVGSLTAQTSKPPLPSAPVEPDKIVQEIADLAARIEDPQGRVHTLAEALRRSGPLQPEQRQTLVDALERAAADADDGTLVGTRDSIIWYAPKTALRIAEQIGDRRHRELYISHVVLRLVDEDPERARELLAELTHPEARYRALLAYAKRDSLDYPQVEALLSEAVDTGFVPYREAERASQFVDVLVPFADERPGEVARFLSDHLKPHEVLSASLHIARRLSEEGIFSPAATDSLVAHAIQLLPATDDPADGAVQLLFFGHRQISSEQAESLFDTYVLEAIVDHRLGIDSSLRALAFVDPDLMASAAQTVAEKLDRPLIEILPQAVGRAAHDGGTEKVLPWLERQPPSLLRDRCIAELCCKFWYPLNYREISNAEVRNLLTRLSQLATRIEDREATLRAGRCLLANAERLAIDDIALLGKWSFTHEVLVEQLRDQEDLPPLVFAELPAEEQRRRLARSVDPQAEQYWKLEGDSPLPTLQRIQHARLDVALKRQWLRAMAEQVHSARVLTRIAPFLAAYDYPAGLEWIWKTLPDIRDPRATRFDPWSASGVPESATAALGLLRGGRIAYSKENGTDAVVDALWRFQQHVPPVDRPAVLEELAQSLLTAGRYERALGIARQINDPQKQASLLAEIVEAAVSGAPPDPQVAPVGGY